jgi:hypothetical protein
MPHLKGGRGREIKNRPNPAIMRNVWEAIKPILLSVTEERFYVEDKSR